MPQSSIDPRYRKTADRLSAQRFHARERVAENRAELIDAREACENILEARRVVQSVSATIQQAAHHRIAGVVTQCLRSVFQDESYEFKIKFEQKRGRTEAVLTLCREGLEVDPMTAAGGGCVDIVAFALRVACVMMSRPSTRKLLVLDEPFSHCKPPEILAPRICQMIEALAEDLGIQFVLVPSIEEHFQVGRVVVIS